MPLVADRVHRWLGSLLWRSALTALIFLAVYVSSARLLIGALPEGKAWLAAELSARTGTTIAIGSVAGQISGFSPELVVKTFALSMPGRDEPTMYVDEASFRLDMWSSLLAMAPRFDTVVLKRPKIDWFINYDTAARRGGAVDQQSVADVSGLLRAFRRVAITDGRMLLTRATRTGVETTVPLTAQIDLTRVGSTRRLRARLENEEGLLITLAGQGVGNPFDPGASRGELHGTIKAQDLWPIAQLFDLNAHGSADLNFWYRPIAGEPSWRFAGAVDDFKVEARQREYRLDRAQVTAALERKENNWQLDLVDSVLQQSAHELAVPRLQLRSAATGWAMSMRAVNIADVTAVLLPSGLLPEGTLPILETLAPSGRIEWMSAELAPELGLNHGWRVRGAVRDVTTHAYAGVPGLVGIDGWLEASGDGAVAWIDTDDFSLTLPRVYERAIDFQQVTGRLEASWQEDALFLRRGVLRGDAGDHQAQVQFAMNIPLAASYGKPLTMDLSVGIPEAAVSVRHRYIPTLVNADVRRWLDRALIDGRLTDVGFIWRGDLKRWDAPEQTLQLGLEVEDANLQIAPEWPLFGDLRARVFMDDARINISSPAASMLGNQLTSTTVEINASRAAVPIVAEIDVDSDITQTLDLLRHLPPLTDATPLLTDLSGSGRITGHLSVSLDALDIERSLGLVVESKIADGRLSSAGLGLSANELFGALDFDLAAGFTATTLKGQVLGVPLSVDIDPAFGEEDPSSVFNGRFTASPTVDALAGWLQPPLALPWSGTVPLQVDVSVGRTVHVGIHSDLQGLALGLPPPVGKSRESRTRLAVELDLDGSAPVDIFWEQRLNARLYRQGGVIEGGSFDLSPTSQPVTPPEPAITAGYYVSGALPTIDIEQWLGVFNALELPAGVVDEPWDLSIESVRVDEAHLGSTKVGAVTVDLTPFAGWEMLGINADWLDAELTLQHDGSRATLILNEINLDRLPDFTSGSSVSLAPPDLTAPIDVVIANLTSDGQQLGAASFALDSDGQQFLVTDLRGRLANIFFAPGSRLAWRQSEGGQTTELTIEGIFGDVGDTLDQLASPRLLETSRGSFSAELKWSDSPLSLSVLTMTGKLNLALREGSFLPVPGQATGALRILSLLNLAGLVQRANITQLFEPGVTFDKAGGDILLDYGVVTIPGFRVDGSGGTFIFDSEIDLFTETIAGELVVTLPLAKNIPWVAALAGGLPIAAGAYVLSKVFEDQVTSLSSGVYSVSGELSKPSVKFERIFDAQSQQSRERQDPPVDQ